MNQPTFYALFLIDDTGVEWFAGAFQSREIAESRGKASGKSYDIRPAQL
jgi:hypothetical protein